jgi:hypothetical protein
VTLWQNRSLRCRISRFDKSFPEVLSEKFPVRLRRWVLLVPIIDRDTAFLNDWLEIASVLHGSFC